MTPKIARALYHQASGYEIDDRDEHGNLLFVVAMGELWRDTLKDIANGQVKNLSQAKALARAALGMEG